MPINWDELHLNWQVQQAQAEQAQAINPVPPGQFVVIDDAVPGAAIAGPVQDFAQFEAQGVNVAAPKPKKTSLYDTFRYPKVEVQKTSAIVANQQQQIRELERCLSDYNGYVTQKQLSEAVNRVLASKKIKRWRPSLGSNKSEFLSEFINVLWAAIPDPVKDNDDSEA